MLHLLAVLSELKRCVKVEMAVLSSPSPTVLTVSVDVKQHQKKKMTVPLAYIIIPSLNWTAKELVKEWHSCFVFLERHNGHHHAKTERCHLSSLWENKNWRFSFNFNLEMRGLPPIQSHSQHFVRDLSPCQWKAYTRWTCQENTASMQFCLFNDRVPWKCQGPQGSSSCTVWTITPAQSPGKSNNQWCFPRLAGWTLVIS